MWKQLGVGGWGRYRGPRWEAGPAQEVQAASGSEVVLVGMGRRQHTGEKETAGGGVLKADLADSSDGLLERRKRRE